MGFIGIYLAPSTSENKNLSAFSPDHRALPWILLEDFSQTVVSVSRSTRSPYTPAISYFCETASGLINPGLSQALEQTAPRE